jgi:hypothetical protein
VAPHGLGLCGPIGTLSNRPQTSINLALGSALASIALTIPAITLIAAFTDVQLALGVPPGPDLGRLLGAVEAWWLREAATRASRDDCLEKLREYAKRNTAP